MLRDTCPLQERLSVSKKNKDRHLKDNRDFDKFPVLDEVLVEMLDELFPEQSADLQWSDREVWYKSGQRSVIRFLEEKLKQQMENII